MSASVTVTPNPASPGSTVAIEGTGFTPKTKIRIKDAGDVWRSRADGGFSVGLVVSATPRTQTVVVQQQVSGAWVTSWSGTVVVQASAPPPPPDTTAPVVSNVVWTATADGKSATIAWDWSEPATGQIDYGTTTAYGSSSVLEPSRLPHHAQTISGLTPGTFYHYRIRGADAAGNVGLSADRTFTTPTVPGPQPPPPPPPTGMEPAWAVALRAAFAGITYTDVQLPPSIDLTGATGVSSALNTFLASVPNGAGPSSHRRIIVPPGSRLRLDGGYAINVKDKSNLTLDLTGVQIENRCTPNSLFSYAFYLLRVAHMTVRGGSIDGMNAGTATHGVTAQESLSAAAIAAGCKFIEFDNVSWDRLWGFGPLICSNEGTVWPENVLLHGGTIRGAEMGVGVTAGRKLLFERLTVKDTQMIAFDLEPDSSQANGGGFEDVLIQDNIVDTYGWHEATSNWFLATVPQAAVMGTATMNRLTARRNRVIRGPANPGNNGNYDGQGGLSVRADATNLKRDYSITDNVSTHPSTLVPGGGRAVMKFDHVSGLTVTGNQQPLSTGAPLIVLGAGVTGAVTAPNVTT